MFHAMFEHDMEEKKNSAVNVEDVESDAMESMLHFIYTGGRLLFYNTPVLVPIIGSRDLLSQFQSRSLEI